MLLVDINIQSLKNKVNELQNWADKVNCSILCVHEHWLRDTKVDIFAASFYDLAGRFCKKDLGQGVPLFI